MAERMARVECVGWDHPKSSGKSWAAAQGFLSGSLGLGCQGRGAEAEDAISSTVKGVTQGLGAQQTEASQFRPHLTGQ